MTTDELMLTLLGHYGEEWREQVAHRDAQAVWKEWDAARASVPPAWIEAALRHLPSRPISALGLRAMAVMHAPPEDARPAPPQARQMPAGVPPEVREALAQSRRAATQQTHDPLAWAKRLQAREQAGEMLTPAIAALWRAVLKWAGPA